MKLVFAQIIEENRIQNLPNTQLSQTTVGDVIQFMAAVGAVIALLVITISALKYIFSQGDPNSISNAKNTIIYAIIGLVISITAYSIVAFVLTEL